VSEIDEVRGNARLAGFLVGVLIGLSVLARLSRRRSREPLR